MKAAVEAPLSPQFVDSNIVFIWIVNDYLRARTEQNALLKMVEQM